MAQGAPAREKIDYICKDVPRFEEPSYTGQSYEAFVPDTLDLQDRATLAVNGLTGPTDPGADCEMYMYVYFGRNKPVMSHDYSVECQAKFQEALPLMRLMTGSSLNSQVDQHWMEATLKMRGPDGLLYFPIKGRPWYDIHCGLNMSEAGRLPGLTAEAAQFGTVIYNGRVLGALGLYHLLTGDDLWKKVAERVVGALGESPEFVFWPGQPRSEDQYASIACGWVVQGLTQYFSVTGYEPALKLAGHCVKKMKNSALAFDGGVAEDFLDQSGRGRTSSRIPFGWTTITGRRPHFHSTTLMLLSMMEYAVAAGDGELMALVQEGYEYGKLLGQATVGYFPERVPNLWSESVEDRLTGMFETSETCEVADMIALGLKLTKAGLGDYWDEVDRWLRNQFAEAQLTDVEWIYAMFSELPEVPYNPMYQTADRVPERNIGAFAGWPSANDWYTGAPHYRGYYPDYRGDVAIMHCCTGNGARAIYYAWERILDFNGRALRVNLLLNRTSPWADVDSHVPYEGRVDVKVKQDCDLLVRIPEWVSPGEVVCQLNEAARSPQWDGRYARIGEVQSGDVAVVSFPIALRRETVHIQGSDYRLLRKGNEVVSIDPPGRHCPLYQRAHYRANATRWKKTTRFVADKRIHW